MTPNIYISWIHTHEAVMKGSKMVDMLATVLPVGTAWVCPGRVVSINGVLIHKGSGGFMSFTCFIYCISQ